MHAGSSIRRAPEKRKSRTRRRHVSYDSRPKIFHYSAFSPSSNDFWNPLSCHWFQNIPTVKNTLSRSDFITHSASSLLRILHLASILTRIPHPASRQTAFLDLFRLVFSRLNEFSNGFMYKLVLVRFCFSLYLHVQQCLLYQFLLYCVSCYCLQIIVSVAARCDKYF